MGSDSLKTLIIALYPYNGQGLDSWHDHGAGMTYTAAKKAGCDVHFLDMKSLNNESDLRKALKGYDIVSFGLKSSYYAIGMSIIEVAKSYGSTTVVGGYHVTAAPKQLLENPKIDYILHGESELTYQEFLKDPSKFPREFFGEKPKNLDDLPFMDRSIYLNQLEPVAGWWKSRKPNRNHMISVMAARGCPYNCAFCQPIERNHFGKALRRRSVDSIIEELIWLKSLYNPDCVMIHDDTFLLQPKWLEEFIDKYPKIGLPFWASGRADGICKHKDLVKALIGVGWELVSVGFESGSQRILDKMKKGTTVEQNLESARIVKGYGAALYANYMLGLPWETKEDIQLTMNMADEIAAEIPSWAFFTPYPGCDLGEECMNLGWSLLDRNNYNRCPSGKKVKYVDYGYLDSVLRKGFREDPPKFLCDIIIPTYNNEHLTVACLKSIKEYTEEGTYRVIWVDNGSTNSQPVDDEIQSINHLAIKLSSNEGFVGAINRGIAQSTAPYVCFLNNDTVVYGGWLAKLISHLEREDDLGIVGPLTMPSKTGMDSHHSLSLHKVLIPESDKPMTLPEINDFLESHYQNKTMPISFVAFLCAVIKRKVINKIGLLDKNYAMGMWDDNDYNLSVRDAGYRTELAMDTCIYHRGRSTFSLIQKEESFDVDALLSANKAYLDKKWKYKSLDTIIISRAIYNNIDERSAIGVLSHGVLKLIQCNFIDSLANQTDKKFKLCIFLGSRHSEAAETITNLDWKSLNIEFVYVEDDLSNWKDSVDHSSNWGKESDYGCPERLIKTLGHPKSQIMARMDIDDWVTPGWVASMKYLAANIDKETFLINYQVIGQGHDGRNYKFFAPHVKSRISPFLAVVQKGKKLISPYEDTHIRMGKLFDTVVTVPPAYCFMVVHGDNRSNRIYEKDIYMEDLAIQRIESSPIIYKVHDKNKRLNESTIRKSSWKYRMLSN